MVTRRLARLLILVGVLAGGNGVGAAPDVPSQERADIEALRAGVSQIPVPGVPGTLSVTGPDAAVAICGLAGALAVPVVATARAERGRVVAFSHNGWLTDPGSDVGQRRLLENALRWCAKAEPGSALPRVGLHGRNCRALAGMIERASGQAVVLDNIDSAGGIDAFKVLVVEVESLEKRDIDRLRTWLQAGGGLVTGHPGWGWAQLNPDRSLHLDNGANQLLAPHGIVWGAGTIDVLATHRLELGTPPPALAHASRALEALSQRTGKDLEPAQRALAVATLTRAIADLPSSDTLLLPDLLRLSKRLGRQLPVPTPQRPLTYEDGLARVLLALDARMGLEAEPGKVQAHPAAEAFPGLVPKRAPRIERTFVVDLRRPRWHSTGLYVAPGEVVAITAPDSVAALKLRLRVGAHTDRLWDKEEWRRAPEVTLDRPLKAGRNQLACAFGGLLYIEVPDATSPRSSVTLRVEGAVAAAWFVLGHTPIEEWRQALGKQAAPWGELEGRNVILTLPTQHLQGLKDPEALLRWWDGVLDACADLATQPRERRSPERFVADEQISVGYMHSGYPIMTHLDAAPRFVDLSTLRTGGDWGMFHELGHNHQAPEWTFDGTVEVTCNLFSLYCMQKCCSEPTFHLEVSAKAREAKEASYLRQGRKFQDWKSSPFLALICYQQLQEAFGWDAFQRVFAQYRALPAEDRPRTDEAKRDAWLTRMSRAVGRDLGPFFEHWGIPVSTTARSTLSDLPPWMP